MKLHLPLSLRSALLACLALFPAAYASTYVAAGVNPDKIADSNRFYDNGLGVYWTAADEQPFTGVQTLYGQIGSTEFLGTLNNYIPAGELSSESFSGLGNDGKTSWLSTTANVIQYWQSYYGVFSQKAGEMPYGYTYAPENQSILGGTQSTNVGMYFYDNWTNSGGDFAMAARWYLTNDHTYTNRGADGVSELKDKNAAAGYFTQFFASHDSSVVVTDPADQEALDAAVVAAFGLTATEKENEYRQGKPGQIAFLGISSGANSDALTCYGFETDANGNVKSLLLASASDAEYTTTKLYVKDGENGARMRLYTDAACTQLWQHGGASDWYIDALSYIETPEVLVNMYNEYSSSILTWTGATSTWTQEADDKSLSILPDATSGWIAHAGTGTEFAGDYAAYYTEGRDVLFTSTGAGTVELIGDIEPSSVTVNNALGADYTFTGEGKLTGIIRLTKQGEGTLTISTANNYSGGTRLEGGTLVAGNTAAFGSAGLELVNGTLDLNGNTIANTIYVSEGAVVTAKNGTSTGDFVLTNATSYTADNFRVLADSITMTGDGKTSSASFINLDVTDKSTADYQGGYLGATSVSINRMADLNIGDAQITKTDFSYNLRGGLIYGSMVNLTDNGSVNMEGNMICVHSAYSYGGLVYGSTVNLMGNGSISMEGNAIFTDFHFYGGLVHGSTVNLTGNGEVRLNGNTVNAQYTVNGVDINAYYLTIQSNEAVEMSRNSAISSSGNVCGGVLYSNNGALIDSNETLIIRDNRAESTNGTVAHGGAIYQANSGTSSSYTTHITGNGAVEISGNAAISPKGEALGGAIYGNGSVQIANNESVLLRGNYEQQGSDYRLRSIYAGGNLELTAKAGQNISVYDSVYTVGNLTLNANWAGGSILLSGEHTAADLLAAKNGVAGTVAEITNSRTNTVVGTTTLGGGTLILEHGAILQTGGFTATAGSDAMVRMDNAVLNSSGYDVTFGSGTILSVGGTNTLTAANLNMGSGSILNIDVRDRNSNLTALALNGNLNLDALEFSVQNADVLAAGKYKLISLGSDSHFDVGSWETVVNSVSGVDADKLSWENGTLYYTSENTWVISKTQDAVILEAPEAGSDIVIGNGVEVELGVCLQGHLGCDNPKHGGRPGNPGQGHDHLKPGNNGNNGNGNGNGNNGNGNGNNKDHGHGSIVIVEGSAYIKNRGDFEGLLEFRGTQEEERHFYTENDLGVEYITVFTDADAESHMHIAEGKTVSAEGIVGDGKLEMHGAGRMVLNGHDADESSTLYYGTLGVNEGAVRVENDSQAYVAHTEVRGAETNAGMEVGRGATMTGESLSVSGENATLHNDGSIAMSAGITVDGGKVKGSGTFSGLTLNGGTLVIGNSPGLQSYTEDLVLGSGDAIFSVGGFEMATATTSGWGEAVYSSVAMGGNTLTIGEGVTITLAFGGSALEDILLSTSETPLTFTLTLATNVGALDVADLNSLAGMTEFRITDELEGLTYLTRELAGLSLDEYVSGVHYSFADGALMLSGSVAVNGNITIPEPTTATLSLLALTMLASRRRRRYGAAEPQRKSA